MPEQKNKKPKESRLVPVITLCVVLSVLFLIPLKVISYGYLPPDDALRHAAKVISEKNWDEILVMRDGIPMDSHPGWHAFLGFFRGLCGWNAGSLVVFSVVFLFLVFCLIPPVFLPRPEAWLLTLLIILLANYVFLLRLFLGRPYIFTMAAVLLISFIWPFFKKKKFPYGPAVILTLAIAASTWIHCGWYLFALPVLCFFLAGQRRAGLRIALCAAAGVAAGAFFTGNAYIFLRQTFLHAVNAFSNHPLQRMLVSEFQPFGGNALMIIAILGILALRRARGERPGKALKDPVFCLMAAGWVLGFLSQRFWLDWGMPAACAWIAVELNVIFEKHTGYFALQRVFLSGLAAAALFLGLAQDNLRGRWTTGLIKENLSLENPEHRKWLPGKGGIFYSSEMDLFYDTFFENPQGEWRYVLGFEPTWMSADNLEIFRNIQWNFHDDKSFRPWVKKMKPADRLVMRRPKKDPPDIPGLEWHYAVTGIWVGHLPKE